MVLFVMILYYLIVAFFTAVTFHNFLKTNDIQASLLYLLMTVPFLLRLCRIK